MRRAPPPPRRQLTAERPLFASGAPTRLAGMSALPHHSRDPIRRARTCVGKSRYLLGAGGIDPAAPSPETSLRERRGCDAAGFLAWCLGYSRQQLGFTNTADWVNADSMIEEAETRGTWFAALSEPEPGAVLAYCSISLDRDGHRDRHAHAALIVSRPPRWTGDAAAWNALRIVHCSPSIQRRRGFAIDETHAAAWALRATFRGVCHPRWRTRFLRYLRGAR